jgi:uncharacterized protein (DUF305 family)
MLHLRRSLLGVLAIVTLVGLSGCKESRSNDAEKNFVARMLPHHALGMQLMNEAMLHSIDVRLRRLVFEMNNYHHSEMTTLKNWQEKWNVTESQTFPGDLDDEVVRRLDALTGVSHDTWWIHLMVIHHEGAVKIADDVLKVTKERDVKEMARSVRSVQEAQLVSMRRLLDDLCNEDMYSPGCTSTDDENVDGKNTSDRDE